MKKFFALLFVFVLLLFHGAFQTYIFKDDFYLFSVSRARNVTELLGFFQPFKPYGFYRPLGIEIFYFLAGLINNLFITRIFVFGLYFLGLVYLYKVLKLINRHNQLSLLVTFMYAVSFTHVYQLYWLATFQEIAVFTFCVISTYFWFGKKFFWSLLFFLAALLSREEAMLLPFILLLLDRGKNWQKILPFFALASLSFILYRINYSRVSSVQPAYVPHLNPRLIGNNVLWYGLWGLGLPSFLPDYFPSILRPPLPQFWEVISRFNAIPYLVSLAVYLATLILTIGAKFKKVRWLIGTCLLLFIFFVSPMSVIIHKWIVRLTLPLIFLTYWQAEVILQSRKALMVILLMTYFTFNILAIPVEEMSSTFNLESKISQRAAKIFLKNQQEIVRSGVVYFSDYQKARSGWEGSAKIKLSLSDQWFLKYYFPSQSVKAIYGFENPVIPDKAVVIDTKELINGI